MALIIEDGSIVAGADSWITLAEWLTYLSAYGRVPTGVEADQEVMLRKAQRAISTRYTFDGNLVEQTQPTVLPRYWPNPIKGFMVASDAIPQDFKDAQSELAWDISEGSDPFANSTGASTGALTGSKSTAGPVSTEKTYSGGGIPFDPRSMSNYTAVNDLLAPYLGGVGSNQIRMVRG